MKKKLLSLIAVGILVLALPVVIFLTKKRQDIRPRALQGKADLLLSSDTLNSQAGQTFNVIVSMSLKDPSLKVSGADFVLLYDKNRLEVADLVPAVSGSGLPVAPFTDVQVNSYGGTYDANFNFLRVSELVRMLDANLPAGTFTLAKVTFRSIGSGTAIIKFPDNNNYIEIVGTGIYQLPTPKP